MSQLSLSRLTYRRKIQKKKSEQSLKGLWGIINDTNIYIMGVPERRGGKGVESIPEEIVDINFPYLMKNINLYIQEAQQIPRRINLKRFTLIYIIIKLWKNRENSESSKRQTTPHIQGFPHYA